MAGDERVLFRSDWLAFGPLALKDVVLAALIAAMLGFWDGSPLAAAAGFATVFVLATSMSAFSWWRELGSTAYSVRDGSLVVHTRSWSRTYPLSEIDSAEVVGAATWRHSVFRLGTGFQPVYPQVRLHIGHEPVVCPPVGVWGVGGAAALQQALDAVLAGRQPA